MFAGRSLRTYDYGGAQRSLSSGRSDHRSGRSGRSDRYYRPGYTPRPGSVGSRSTVYTADRNVSNVQLKRILEQHFRPLFQGFVYGGEQITNSELRQHLLDDEYRRMLPRDRLYAVMDLVDYNPNKSISYEAFKRMVLGDHGDSDSALNSDFGSDFDENKDSRLYLLLRNTTPYSDLISFVPRYKWYRPPPFFILLVSVIQVITYIVYAAQLTREGTAVTALDGVPVTSNMFYNQARRYEAWRFLTYAFLHQGWLDLVFTLLLQLLICFPLEIVYSFWRVALVWVFGVMAGSLAQSISDHYVGLVGGSGGTYSIVAAHFLAMIYHWKELRKVENNGTHRTLCGVPLRMTFILLLVLPQIGVGVYRRFFAPDILNIGIGAYVGGIFMGLMLCEAFLKDRVIYPWQKNAGWMNFFMILIFVGGCVVFNFLYRGYPATDYS